MTVKELIEKLQKFPENALVLHTYCSDYAELDEPSFWPAIGGKRPHPWRTGEMCDTPRIVFRQGHYMSYNEKQWAVDEAPQFIDVVHFAGN